MTKTSINSKLSPYIVYYGFSKLTKKAVRKRSVVIQYANTKLYNNERQQKYINQKMQIVYFRFQTEEEAKFCGTPESTRSWTKWEYFVDDKRWYGNLDAVLDDNFKAESENVSVEEREKIREALKNNFEKHYKQYKTKRNESSNFRF